MLVLQGVSCFWSATLPLLRNASTQKASVDSPDYSRVYHRLRDCGGQDLPVLHPKIVRSHYFNYQCALFIRGRMGGMNSPPWVDGKPIPGIIFAYNSMVQIVGGEHAGETGWLVGVDPRPSDPIYTVELTSGEGDTDVPQSQLRAAAD